MQEIFDNIINNTISEEELSKLDNNQIVYQVCDYAVELYQKGMLTEDHMKYLTIYLERADIENVTKAYIVNKYDKQLPNRSKTVGGFAFISAKLAHDIRKAIDQFSREIEEKKSSENFPKRQ